MVSLIAIRSSREIKSRNKSPSSSVIVADLLVALSDNNEDYCSISMFIILYSVSPSITCFESSFKDSYEFMLIAKQGLISALKEISMIESIFHFLATRAFVNIFHNISVRSINCFLCLRFSKTLFHLTRLFPRLFFIFFKYT